MNVGANDGFFSSNSDPFIARGWSALLVEPHPEAFRAAQRRHRRRAGVTLVEGGSSTTAGPMPLTIRLDNHGGSHSHLGPCPQTDPERGANAETVVLVAVHRLESLLEVHCAPPDLDCTPLTPKGMISGCFREPV